MRGGAWLALFCLLLVPAPAPAGEAAGAFGRYHALVVGNDDYRQLPKLKTAVRDAEAVAALLEKRYGFAVRLLKNATRDDLLRALNGYRADLVESDSLLIYYAGHGWLDRETNTGFWQPVDAAVEDDVDWIPNEELTRRLKAMAARHVMVVADSCFSGTLVRAGESSPAKGAEQGRWLEKLASKRSRTAIVSGGLEPVADRGKDGHSVFANAFLAALAENDRPLNGTGLFERVSRPVMMNAEQTPQYSDIREAGHEGGEFIFLPRDLKPRVVRGAPVATAPPSPAAKPATDPKAVEILFWQSIEDSELISDYEAYLAKYPDGEFAPLAAGRWKALREAELAKEFRERIDGSWLSQELVNPFDAGVRYRLHFAFKVAGDKLVGAVVEKSMPGSSRQFVVERGILDGEVGEDSISFRVPYEITVKDEAGKEKTEMHHKLLTGRLNLQTLELVMQDDHGFPPEQFTAKRVPVNL